MTIELFVPGGSLIIHLYKQKDECNSILIYRILGKCVYYVL